MEKQKYPASWAVEKLGNVMDIQGGSQPPKSEFIYESAEGYIQLLQIRDFGDKPVPTFVPISRVTKFCKKTDVLIARYGASLGRIVTGLEGAYNVALAKTIYDKRLFDDRFVFFLLKTPVFQTPLKMISRSAQNGFARHEVAHVELPIPPLNEQRRIVAKIEALFSELDKGIEALKTAREQLKVYRQAVLKHAFEGKFTARWREENKDKLETPEQLLARIQRERQARYQQQLKEWQTAVKAWEKNGKVGKKPGKPKEPEILCVLPSDILEINSDLPLGWSWAKLDWLLSLEKKPMTTGPFGTALKKSEHKSEGVPVLGIENIGQGKFLPGNKIFVSLNKAKELSSFRVFPKEIVISRSGTVGEICEVPSDVADALISTNLLRISLNQNVILSPYFVLMFQGGGVKLQVKDLCKGSSREFLNQSILGSIRYPLCGLEEQREIIKKIEERFSIIDKNDEEIEQTLSQSETLRHSILKKAFAGHFVPQDQNDESASVLLERIKAEKEELVSIQKRGGRKSTDKSLPSDNVIPMPQRISGISTIDLHAGILALAYSSHQEKQSYAKTFHHVKGEKIIHLAGSHLGIELDRDPVKAAAGPNDFQRMKKVEFRASKANWFTVKKDRATGIYNFIPGRNLEALQDKTRKALGDYLPKVEALLLLLRQLDTRRAEIVATVYAAWNNLLLEGRSPDDEEIITEARENWHPDKMKIPRLRFFKELEWMRENSLVPRGQGRFVEKKADKRQRAKKSQLA